MILFQPYSGHPVPKILLLLLAFSLGALAGCKKQQQAKEVPPSATEDASTPAASAAASTQRRTETPTRAVEKLRGTSIVRDDLKNKNYSKAVEGLLVLRPFAVSDEQWMEYRELSSEVAQSLAAAARTDPNAAQALTAYNLALYGR
jgi:hypothetical protein